jgi:hypothetical protein
VGYRNTDLSSSVSFSLLSCSFVSSFSYRPGIAQSSRPVLFADDTSIIITNPSPSKFKEDINNIINNINNWFRCNSLLLNFTKTYFLQFRSKNSYKIDIKKLSQ